MQLARVFRKSAKRFDLRMYGARMRRVAIAITLALLGLLASCTASSEDDRPELHVAVARNDLAFVQKWIRDRRNVDREYNDRRFTLHGSGARVRGQTALMVAAARGHFEIVKLLVDAGANVSRESVRADGYGEGQTVFDYAVEGGDVQVIRYIWNASDKRTPPKHLSTNFVGAFDHACRSFPTEKRTDLLNFFISSFDKKYASHALWRITGYPECIPAIHFILDQGVTPGPSALIAAASLDLSEIVLLYLRRGGNVNALGCTSCSTPRPDVTPLIEAAERVHLGTMSLLLQEGADPNLQDNRGRTALIALVSERQCLQESPFCASKTDGIRLLLRHGARIDFVDRQGRNANGYLDLQPSNPYMAIQRGLLTGGLK